MPLEESEIGNALLLYDRAMFWDYGDGEIQKLGPDFVIPRITRYGTLEDIIRLYVIYPVDIIRKIAELDLELNVTEKTFLISFYIRVSSLSASQTRKIEADEPAAPAKKTDRIIGEAKELASLLEIGVAKMHNQNRQNIWEDIADLYAITEHHTLSELLMAYNRYHPAWPTKQCFMALWSNLQTPPPTEDFLYGKENNLEMREKIIATLKEKCIGVGDLMVTQESQIIRSWLIEVKHRKD